MMIYLAKHKQVPFLREQMLSCFQFRFRYVGDTIGNGNDTSKAYTDPVHKWILIGKK